MGPVVVSVGAESTSVAVRRAEHALSIGANAVMATPPISVAGATDLEQEQYYGAILRAVDLPLIVQDASGYVGRSLGIHLQVHLFEEFGDRVLFKPEGPPVGIAISSIMEQTHGGARIFEGLGGGALIESYRRGVVGSMPGADVCWAVIAVWRALESGDFRRAYESRLRCRRSSQCRQALTRSWSSKSTFWFVKECFLEPCAEDRLASPPMVRHWLR